MQLETHGGKWKKEKKMTKSGRVKETHVPPKRPVSDKEQYGESTNPFPEIHEGMAKEMLRREMKKAGLKTVDNMYNVVLDKDKKEKIKATAKKLSNMKYNTESKQKKKDGGLMEAIKKVDAEKGMKDGGMVGNSISNFKGTY